MGRRRRRCDGGQRRRQGLRLPRREDDLEQALFGGEGDAAASTGVEQEESRDDACATVAADENVMLSI